MKTGKKIGIITGAVVLVVAIVVVLGTFLGVEGGLSLGDIIIDGNEAFVGGTDNSSVRECFYDETTKKWWLPSSPYTKYSQQNLKDNNLPFAHIDMFKFEWNIKYVSSKYSLRSITFNVIGDTDGIINILDFNFDKTIKKELNLKANEKTSVTFDYDNVLLENEHFTFTSFIVENPNRYEGKWTIKDIKVVFNKNE